jgi:clan AA aspartic protease (TIGR02281 family)
MAGLLKRGVFSAACFTLVWSSAVSASALWAAPPGSAKGDNSKSGATNEAERAARSKLSEKGVRVSHSGLALIDEKELGSAFNRANIFRRKLASASKELQSMQQRIEDLEDNLREHHQIGVVLNTQMANGARSSQIIGGVNANIEEINLLRQEQESCKKNVDLQRKDVNTTRESFSQQIADVRSLVNRLSQRYQALKADANVQSALAEWNAAASTSFELKPSPYFLNSVKRLEALEKSVAPSEKITLRREGNSYYATVTINGKQTEDMIVDTGANSIVLPYKVAVNCGIKPEESAIDVIAVVADGSKVKSKQVQLDSVKVGDFTAERVTAIVLPEHAKNAPMLLGMTFLSRFNFGINGTELSLTKFDADPTAKPKKAHPSKSSRKSRKSKPKTDPSAE